MIYLITYLIGYVIAYYLGRYEKRKKFGSEYDWEDVKFLFWFSLFSWSSVIIIGLIIINKTEFFNKKYLPNKPPKWL